MLAGAPRDHDSHRNQLALGSDSGEGYGVQAVIVKKPLSPIPPRRPPSPTGTGGLGLFFAQCPLEQFVKVGACLRWRRCGPRQRCQNGRSRTSAAADGWRRRGSGRRRPLEAKATAPGRARPPRWSRAAGAERREPGTVPDCRHQSASEKAISRTHVPPRIHPGTALITSRSMWVE